MAPRLKDIAEAAGVDAGTVSHVLNNRPKAALLRPETCERIRRIASEMGYCRDEFAASVAKRRSNVLAFITADMGDISYTGRIQNGVLDAASERDYALSNYHLTGKNQEEICRRLVGWRTAGAVFHIAALESASGVMETLTKNGIPFATANLLNPDGMGVTTDDAQGIFDMVALMKRCGARKPVLLTIKDSDRTEYLLNREAGFRRGIAEYYAGMEPEIAVCGIGCADMPRTMPEELRARGVDAVVCISDYLAFRFSQECQFDRIRIPDDMLLSGFGGLSIFDLAIPRLTTVLQGFEEMGRRAAELVLDCAEQGKSGRTNVVLPVKILERESTGEKR